MSRIVVPVGKPAAKITIIVDDKGRTEMQIENLHNGVPLPELWVANTLCACLRTMLGNMLQGQLRGVVNENREAPPSPSIIE